MKERFKILCKPKNETYIYAKGPRVSEGYVFWFDDNERERGAKVENLEINDNGIWRFNNPNRKETITFVPVGVIVDRYWESRDTLKAVCKPEAQDKAYFRPFLCRGNLGQASIFIVGINPATPIFEKQLSLEQYSNMLLDYDAFMAYYKSLRKSQGKSEMSYTREGLDSFGGWLASISNSIVVETNIIAYPTKSEKELNDESEHIRVQGKELFVKLLFGIQPSLIVLHSLRAVKEFIRIIKRYGLITDNLFYTDKKIEEIEGSSPIFEFTYTDGKKCTVFACRHLKSYRKTGKSFKLFREKIQEWVSSNM